MDRPGMDPESDEGTLMDGILGIFTAFERKRIARRTRAGLNERVQSRATPAGTWNGFVDPSPWRLMWALACAAGGSLLVWLLWRDAAPDRGVASLIDEKDQQEEHADAHPRWPGRSDRSNSSRQVG